MELERGLRWRWFLSGIFALGLLAYFVERMASRKVTAEDRGPASVPAKIIESCEDDSCLGVESSKDHSSFVIDGQMYRADSNESR